MQAIAWLANASLISTTSRSPVPIPARSSALRDAPIGPSPIVSGSQPDTPIALIRARIVSPCFRANASDVTSTALAPSVSGEEVPAVTDPSAEKAGFSPPSASTVVSGRSVPSCVTCPALVAIGTISSASRPSARAAAAFCWLLTAKASCSARVIWYFSATFSAVCPMPMYAPALLAASCGLGSGL